MNVHGTTHEHESCRFLYAGIIGDTGEDQYDNTVKQTMSLASGILDFNFKAQDILMS